MPSIITQIDGKSVISGATGDSFAFLLGENMKLFDEN